MAYSTNWQRRPAFSDNHNSCLLRQMAALARCTSGSYSRNASRRKSSRSSVARFAGRLLSSLSTSAIDFGVDDRIHRQRRFKPRRQRFQRTGAGDKATGSSGQGTGDRSRYTRVKSSGTEYSFEHPALLFRTCLAACIRRRSCSPMPCSRPRPPRRPSTRCPASPIHALVDGLAEFVLRDALQAASAGLAQAGVAGW